MKRIIDFFKTQDGVLAGALVFLLAGSGFALLHALTEASASIGLVAPILTSL